MEGLTHGFAHRPTVLATKLLIDNPLGGGVLLGKVAPLDDLHLHRGDVVLVEILASAREEEFALLILNRIAPIAPNRVLVGEGRLFDKGELAHLLDEGRALRSDGVEVNRDHAVVLVAQIGLHDIARLLCRHKQEADNARRAGHLHKQQRAFPPGAVIPSATEGILQAHGREEHGRHDTRHQEAHEADHERNPDALPGKEVG